MARVLTSTSLESGIQKTFCSLFKKIKKALWVMADVEHKMSKSQSGFIFDKEDHRKTRSHFQTNTFH